MIRELPKDYLITFVIIRTIIINNDMSENRKMLITISFRQTDETKRKDIQFTGMLNGEKQKILTVEGLEPANIGILLDKGF